MTILQDVKSCCWANAAGAAEDTYTTYAWNAAGGDTGDLRVKTVHDGLSDQGTVTETTTFEYNVQGRTGKITTVKAGQTTEITYKYNLQGIRVEEATTAGGVTTTKSYLIDQANFTGYSQVLEEYVNGQLAKTFTLGHDVLTQADAQSGPLTLIYDGHGSTRALLDAAAAAIQRYAYEAFGQMLAGQGLAALSAALTSLLYSGEMTDKLTGLQNLRDRLYDTRTGRFTQFDRYAGRNGDPASLHKYVYTHGNPINHGDPSGQSIGTLVDLAFVAFARPLFEGVSFVSRHGPAITTATTVAGWVSILSGIQLLLEQNGIVPQTGYTEEVFAVSAFLFTMGFSMSVLTSKAQPVLRPIRNSPQGQIINSGTANNRFAEDLRKRNPSASPSAPYQKGTLASQGKLAPGNKVVRFYNPDDPDTPTKQAGGWACFADDVEGLTPQQIRDKYSLPNTPTMMTDVEGPNVEVRVGYAGPNWGGNGGGVQVEFLGEVKFLNPRPIQ